MQFNNECSFWPPGSVFLHGLPPTEECSKQPERKVHWAIIVGNGAIGRGRASVRRGFETVARCVLQGLLGTALCGLIIADNLRPAEQRLLLMSHRDTGWHETATHTHTMTRPGFACIPEIALKISLSLSLNLQSAQLLNNTKQTLTYFYTQGTCENENQEWIG